MNRYEAQRFAYDLFEEFGLTGWNFVWDNSVKRFGQCRFSKREIGVSRKLAQLNPDEVEDVIRHEVAHAISPSWAGHGPRWKASCRLTGARPERCYDSERVTAVEAPLRVVCPECGWKAPRHRRKTGNYYHCRKGAWVYYESA